MACTSTYRFGTRRWRGRGRQARQGVSGGGFGWAAHQGEFMLAQLHRHATPQAVASTAVNTLVDGLSINVFTDPGVPPLGRVWRLTGGCHFVGQVPELLLIQIQVG